MPWLYLVLAVVAMAIAFKTTSVAVLVVCLLTALGLAIAWLMAFLAERIESRSSSPAMLIDPVELQRLREQAEARRATAGPAGSSTPLAGDDATG